MRLDAGRGSLACVKGLREDLEHAEQVHGTTHLLLKDCLWLFPATDPEDWFETNLFIFFDASNQYKQLMLDYNFARSGFQDRDAATTEEYPNPNLRISRDSGTSQATLARKEGQGRSSV